MVAREGPVGLSALYDDGHVLEFAADSVAEFGDIRIGDHEIAYDAGPVASIVGAATGRRREDPVTARDDAGLTLVKLLIGVGRTRRGELISGEFFVRTYAVGRLVRAVRARAEPRAPPVADPLDPLRRFERDYPTLGARLVDRLELPVEQAARGVLDVLRSSLEPGWDDFPSAAADLVASRLGWTTP